MSQRRQYFRLVDWKYHAMWMWKVFISQKRALKATVRQDQQNLPRLDYWKSSNTCILLNSFVQVKSGYNGSSFRRLPISGLICAHVTMKSCALSFPVSNARTSCYKLYKESCNFYRYGKQRVIAYHRRGNVFHRRPLTHCTHRRRDNMSTKYYHLVVELWHFYLTSFPKPSWHDELQ